jgi:predicted permease
LNGQSYTIVGVLAPRLKSVAGFGLAPGIYLPLNRTLVPDLQAPSAAVVKLLGRLKPGQSFAEGRAALDAVDRRLARLAGDSLYGGVQVFARVGGLGSGKAVRVISGFFALLGLVSLFVLLIACANVAGLLIARGTRRRQEIAIRMAIGGSRSRVVQQLLVEGFWLAVLGTTGGLLLSLVFMRLINSMSLPVPFPIALHLAPDRAVFLCALGVVILTLLCCAVLPAMHATRMTLVRALKTEEPFYLMRRVTARGVLLTGQVAVSTILLVTSFLFVRNLMRTQVTNPGFEVNRTLVAQVGFVRGRNVDDHPVFLRSAVERVRALPGVVDASYADGVPLTVHGGSTSGLSARIGGNAKPEHVQFARQLVGPAYFRTIGIRLIAGREFEHTDGPGATAVVIINEEFSRRYFRGENPVGQHITFTDDRKEDLVVVGVAANGKHLTLGEDQRAALYRPIEQQRKEGVLFMIVRTRGEPAALANSVRQAIGELDRSISVAVEPMTSALQFALLPSRIGATVLGTLGMLGLVLAAFGLYAMVSYTVSRRVGEIAIRSALGASRASILRLVMRDASVHVGVGLVIGLGISAFITSPLATFLVAGLSATDPLSFAGTALAFLAVSLLASWLPAQSATRVSPAAAMRLD